jgi:hypothetical protein
MNDGGESNLRNHSDIKDHRVAHPAQPYCKWIKTARIEPGLSMAGVYKKGERQC